MKELTLPPELSCEIRETKVGAEEITRDIPGVSEAALSNLDETGLIHEMADGPGDLVAEADILEEAGTAEVQETILEP